jgi:hypothetical protein
MRGKRRVLGNESRTQTAKRFDTNEHINTDARPQLVREVATLVNEEKPAGTYSIAWNAGGLGSGVYSYRLSAGQFSDMKRSVLVR